MKPPLRTLYLFLICLFFFRQTALPENEAVANQNESSSAPGDEFWDGRFNVLGVNGYVRAMAVSGTDLYVGGLFNSVGSVSANNIARWDSLTGTWSALGGGVSGTVLSIAVTGSDVYVGGYFFSAGGIPSVPGTQGIARWNSATNTWSALDTGVPGYVYAIAVKDNDVYAGGLFNAAGGVSASNVARYTAATNTWSALGNGVGYKVFALAVSGDIVYVGGYFAAASNVPGTQSIAQWNAATHTWSALGSGIGGYVHALAVVGNDVYAGGLFNAVNGFPSIPNTQNIARWNSATNTWSALGSGISSYVYSLTVSGGDLYAGGLFNAAGGVANTHNIARWDGDSWSALGSGVGGYVYALAVGAEGVFSGGLFNAAGDKASHNFGLWQGNVSDPPDPKDVYWDDRIGNSLNFGTLVSAVAASGTDVFVGGNFYTAGGLPGTRGIAKWNSLTGSWASVGNGINDGRVEAIALSENYVYIGGQFNKIFGSPGNSVARWDGNTWSDMGGGVNGLVVDIEISEEDVYVLGTFSSAGGQDATRIARWNSVTGVWSPLGSGVGFGANHLAIRSNGNVLVAGTLTEAGGVPVNYVAQWDGNNWTAFGSGLTSCCVAAIETNGGTAYIGGSFEERLAQGTGSIWTQVGSDLNGTVSSIALGNGDLFVGGSFTMAGGVNANRIAKWNGENWLALGSGLNNSAVSLALDGSDLYAGGLFGQAGNKPSLFFGLWHDGPLTSPEGSILGLVTDPNGNPISGALVQVCLAGGICPWKGSTDAQGNYAATQLLGGNYAVKGYPTSTAAILPASSPPLSLVSGGSLSGQNLQLSSFQPPPLGTSLTPGHIAGPGIPSVDWNTPLQLTTQGCAGGSASYQLTQEGAHLQSGLMVEQLAGQYLADIPPLSPNYGYGTASIALQCSALAYVNDDIQFTFYLNPGNVVRTIDGDPLPDATVTLYYFDPESGEFIPVPDGDAAMSPVNRTNPDLTDSNGHFGWDVIAGFYKVRAEKPGCIGAFTPLELFVETDILALPQQFTDLDLRLDCGDSVIYLPVIKR